jgi:hypothetical protein
VRTPIPWPCHFTSKTRTMGQVQRNILKYCDTPWPNNFNPRWNPTWEPQLTHPALSYSGVSWSSLSRVVSEYLGRTQM